MLALLLALSPTPRPAPQVLDQLVPVPADRVLVTGSFWAPRVAGNRATTLPALCAELEERGYLANFEKPKEHAGGPEADALVYRAIHAVALSLRASPDDALRDRVAAWIPRIAAAQADDGYLDTYVTTERPGARFAELRTSLEPTCLAALIDAGVEWERTTGDAALLDVAVRAAGRLERAVHDDGVLDPPGRPGVERALAILAQRTGKEDWLWLGDDLLAERGSADGRAVWGPDYQDSIPVRKLFSASGDALGYLGLARGMVEEFAATGEYDLLAAVLNGWKDLTQARSFVTGGVGVEPRGLFPEPYQLVSRLARCSPQTSVELVLLARRLLSLTRQAAFADFEEVVLYNALAAGSSPDGRTFLGACPLEARGGLKRTAWLDDPAPIVALADLYADLSTGFVLHDEDDVYVAHYASGEANLLLPGGKVRIEQTTEYPWDGKVEIRVVPEKPMKLNLNLRVPAWVGDELEAGVDAKMMIRIDRGDEPGMWLTYQRTWTGKEKVLLDFPMPARRITPDPRASGLEGRVAIARGPLVYAVEAVDNGGAALNLALPPKHVLEEHFEPGLAGGGWIVRADGTEPVALTPRADVSTPTRLTAIPYALIANRDPSDLAVWLPQSPGRASLSNEVTERAGDLVLHASFCNRLESLAALVDGEVPKRSSDRDVPAVTFRPHSGTKEWVEIDLPEPRSISGVRVFWVDSKVDGPGLCDTPRSWRMLKKDGDGWTPLKPADGEYYWTSTDTLREVPFAEPVTTRALRMELDLRPDRSAGLFELDLVSP